MDAHGSLFDSAALAGSRLDELRDLMAVVWTASSDALAISVRHRNAQAEGVPVIRVETSVIPTAEAMLTLDGTCTGVNGACANAGGGPADWKLMRFVRSDYGDTKPAVDILPTNVDPAKGGPQDAVFPVRGFRRDLRIRGTHPPGRRARRLYEFTEPSFAESPADQLKNRTASCPSCISS